MDPIQAQKLIENSEAVKCSCAGEIFAQGIAMKKVSALDPNNPTGQNQYANIPIMYCVKCGKQFVNPK